MGLPHRPNHGKQLPVDILLARREVFPAIVPDGVALLTAGVDTQDDRFEITITGWGRDEESWSVAHDVIYGDLETDEPWKRLDAYLKQIWRRGDGRGLNIMATCMDSGGHHTQKFTNLLKSVWGVASGQSKVNLLRAASVIRLANQTTDIEKQSQFPANYDWRELCERCCPWSPAS
jgi:phage terminase large subunit GpA-like protein